jgi:ferredoxin
VNYLKNVVTLAIDGEKCTGCGLCVDVCPRRVLALIDGKAGIIERDACIECGACRRNCAFGAVAVSSGVGCARALFNALLRGGEPVCDCEKSGRNRPECC